MATDMMTGRSMNVVLLVALLLLAFAGGYYYYREKDKDTLFNFQVGDQEIKAEVDHE